MTVPACRFEPSRIDSRTDNTYCNCHGHRSRADICDIGLAALRRQLDEQARVIGRLLPVVEGLASLYAGSLRSANKVAGRTFELIDAAVKALSPTEPTEA